MADEVSRTNEAIARLSKQARHAFSVALLLSAKDETGRSVEPLNWMYLGESQDGSYIFTHKMLSSVTVYV